MGRIRLGLLGGTFDPPHFGHLWLAEAAREALQLDRVLFLPVGEPPHKQGKPITAVAHRLAMTQLAIADNPAFALDQSDIMRQPPHTTVSLLPLLRQRYPATDFWLLIGGDSLRDLPTWHEPSGLIKQCRLAVLPRPDVAIDWAWLETAVPGLRQATDLLPGPTIDISATAIRHWARHGRSLRYLLPDPVIGYIRQHHLYRQ